MKKNPNVLALVEKYRYRKGIVVTDEKSALYKTFKITYIISFIWAFIFNAMFLIGNVVALNFSEVKINTTPAITLSIATTLLITGFIFLLKRLYIAGGVLNIVSIIMGTIQYYTLLLNDLQLNGGITHFFYWRHLVPAILVIITCIVVCFIGIKSKVLLNRDYKIVTEKLYIKYSDKISNISDEDWNKLLESGELFETNDE